MEQNHIIRTLIVLALIIAGMFVFAYIKRTELRNETQTQVPSGQAQREDRYAGITRIEAKHFFIGGTHTLVGEIIFPTPCDLLNWSTRIQESFPETAIVDFDVVNNAEACAQVATPQRFKVTFSASENANIRATLEGKSVELNLVPAGPGESPDDYELFIKG